MPTRCASLQAVPRQTLQETHLIAVRLVEIFQFCRIKYDKKGSFV